MQPVMTMKHSATLMLLLAGCLLLGACKSAEMASDAGTTTAPAMTMEQELVAKYIEANGGKAALKAIETVQMEGEVYMPMAETWVYVHEDQVVGFIALVGHEVGALFVAPVWHGHGFGRALMDHACRVRMPLEVEVFKANRLGRRFYDRYGFVVMNEHSHEQTGHPLLRMRLAG